MTSCGGEQRTHPAGSEEPGLCGSLCLRPPSTHANRPPFRFTAERDRSRGDSGLADLLEGRISGIYRLGGVHGEPATARGQSQSLRCEPPWGAAPGQRIAKALLFVAAAAVAWGCDVGV